MLFEYLKLYFIPAFLFLDQPFQSVGGIKGRDDNNKTFFTKHTKDIISGNKFN